MNEMKGIILHGGHGTRLRPLTHTGPKQLLPIANKPMSRYALEDLIDAGIRDIAILLGDIFPDKVKEFYGDGTRLGAKISYIYQDKPRGISHAIQICKDFIGSDKKFVVYLGDNILNGGIKRYVSRFIESKSDAIILLCQVKEPSHFGIVTIRGKNIEKIIEKPKNSRSNLAVIGVYFLDSSVFQIIDNLRPSYRGELEITEALQAYIDSGRKIEYYNVSGWWKDLGTPQDILDANALILENLDTEIYGVVESTSSLDGPISIGKNTKISKGSIIRGPTIIGENSYIGSLVRVGPFTSIGNNVNVKQADIENSIIMDNCIIDTPTRIINSIIGNDSRITTMSPNSNPNKDNVFLLGERSQVSL
jgi:glucose-1-phosphate thymidylyltransferase